MRLIYRWKVAGIPVKPKGATSHSKRPYLVRKAVFHSSPPLIRILWNAVITSNFVNHLAFENDRSVSLIKGRGYRSLRGDGVQASVVGTET